MKTELCVAVPAAIDLLALFAVAGKKEITLDDNSVALSGDQLPATVLDDFTAEAGKEVFLYPGSESPADRLLLVGLGSRSDWKEKDELAELLRQAGGRLAGSCRKAKAKDVMVAVPQVKGIKPAFFVEYLLEGLLLGLYSFTRYKTEKKEGENDWKAPKRLHLLVEEVMPALKQAVKRAERAAAATNTARDMANEPGNGWTPSSFAAFGRKLAKEQNVHCRVLERADMEKLGMGGLLGVNQGSHEAPKLVAVEYRPEKYKKTVLLVGKGLTFDSGGVSLKPGAGMMDMKYDMCGGAAVMAAMQAIIAEQPAVRVVGVVPSTDNMAGGGALKPGDIITHFGGKTSEIENTDAEGRLILADALAWGIEQYEPDCVVDLATLTGAAIICLGHHRSAILSNDDDLCEALISAAGRAGEPQWRLPLGKEYAKQLESKVADMKNTGGRPGGTITAAEYLHAFVGETPWAHLDIAATAWDFTEKSYIPKGPSGTGARTLIEFVCNVG